MGHTHSPNESRQQAKFPLTVAASLTFALLLAEFIGGLLSNSLALLSDAGHMLADVVALTLSLLSIHWATKPASTERSFGHYRIEVLATLVNGGLLLFMAFQILAEAGQRFLHPVAVNLRVMLPIATAGLLVNLICLLLLRKRTDHLLTRSAFLHVLSDLISSVGVVLSGALIYATGWRSIDTFASVFISVLILVNGWKLLRETFDILMESSPKGIVMKDVRHEILDVSGVEDVHDLHVWTIGSNFYALSVHVLIRNMTVQESDRIVELISHRLRERFSITHSTVQVAAMPAPAQIQAVPL